MQGRHLYRVAVIAAIALTACGSGKGNVASKSTTTAPSTTAATDVTTTSPATPATCPNADGSTPQKQMFDAAPGMCIDATKHYTATVTTDVGTFTVALDTERTPITANNFVVLARYHYYDGVTFHRVIPNFVVQGGDPGGTGAGQYPGYSFKDEALNGTTYAVGDLAMANAGPDTNGSQFFIITGADGASLPPNYTRFGKVTSGMDIVMKIVADGGTSSGGGTDLKVKHHMVSVKITEA
jgi:cyclophilin family peptidyl-prolyl cis-trans isomerase